MGNEQRGHVFEGNGAPRNLRQMRRENEPIIEEVGIMERRYLIIVVPLLISCLVYFMTKGLSSTRAAGTIDKAFLAFRHGSRAPTYTYESDEHRHNFEKYYPEGLDKLTNAGKKEAFELGKRLRERYADFIGPIYKSQEVRVFSTLMDRTMMSGQLVMASFFPPQSYQVWNEELEWQPVPIYPEYIFNATNGGSCPRFRLEAFPSVYEAYKSLNASEMDAVLQVIKHAGEPAERTPPEVFVKVWDTVYFQDKANLDLPSWIKDIFPMKMTRAAIHLLKGFLLGNDIQKSLIYWNYATALLDFLYAENNVKMEVHSWHDLNNIVLLCMFGVKLDFFPEPTSCIALELHKRGEEKYFEIHYYDNYKSLEPRLLEMECGLSCPLEEIQNIVEKFRVENYNELCNNIGRSNPEKVPKLKILV